ncbi:MAG: hypothetical protein EOO09_00110 [Chitinophagaceae bacterium]|nr:MAG: hypothetical protein EOO09_00110 [Chitinophagaceae bacterium]
MLHLILGYIICMGFMLGVYYLLLERLAWFRFNRFYLILCLLLPMVLPLVRTSSGLPIRPVPTQILDPDKLKIIKATQPVPFEESVAIATHPTADASSPISLPVIIACIWVFLLIRFVYNLLQLLKKGKGLHLKGQHVRVCPVPGIPHPFTFWRTIYVNQQEWERGQLDPAVLTHECVHARELHSADVLATEFLRLFFFFNPFLPFLRRAINQNHEYLADAAVAAVSDPVAYQYLLIGSGKGKDFQFASHLNYSSIKKRIIMINKKTTVAMRVMAAITGVLVITASAILFTARAAGPTPRDLTNFQPGRLTDTIPGETRNLQIPGGQGISEEEENEYRGLLEQMLIPGKESEKKAYKRYNSNVLTKGQNKRMGDLYLRMTPDQRIPHDVVIRKRRPATPGKVPTEAEFESYKNAAVYRVQINGKRVSNSDLSAYRNSDFALASVEKLVTPAGRPVAYTHGLQLLTPEYYRKYTEAVNNRPEYDLFFPHFPEPKKKK